AGRGRRDLARGRRRDRPPVGALNPPMQLVGKLYREGGGWAADWIFVDDGEVLDRWSSSDRNALRAMAAGADGAADALAARYARAESIGEPGHYRVAFTGIDDATDYMRL